MTNKIALCFSGQARLREDCRNSLFDSIIKPLEDFGFVIHTFCHFWCEHSLDKIHGSDRKEVGKEAIKNWVDRFPHSRFHVDEPLSRATHTSRFPRSIKEHFVLDSQYFSLQKVRDMMRSSESQMNEKYEFALRLRTDMYYHNKLDAKLLEKSRGCLLVPFRQGHGWVNGVPPKQYRFNDWLPDQWWAGDRDIIDHLMSFYENFDDSLVRFGKLNGVERLLSRYWARQKKWHQITRINLLTELKRESRQQGIAS